MKNLNKTFETEIRAICCPVIMKMFCLTLLTKKRADPPVEGSNLGIGKRRFLSIVPTRSNREPLVPDDKLGCYDWMGKNIVCIKVVLLFIRD